jgi:hypothetical protein
MRWGTLPTKIQRELFDHATSLADLAQTAPPNDDSAHNSDGLLLNGLDGDQQVTGSSAGVSWTTGSIPDSPTKGGKSLYRAQYNELGKRNLAAIERIVTFKYQRGPAFNRQYLFVDILLSDITETGRLRHGALDGRPSY